MVETSDTRSAVREATDAVDRARGTLRHASPCARDLHDAAAGLLNAAFLASTTSPRSSIHPGRIASLSMNGLAQALFALSSLTEARGTCTRDGLADLTVPWRSLYERCREIGATAANAVARWREHEEKMS